MVQPLKQSRKRYRPSDVDEGTLGSKLKKRSEDEFQDAIETQQSIPNIIVDDPQNDNAWIESIELKNFMCHENLKVQFSPRVNFITGVNGSGKSAIFAGLMACFSAKTNATDRGRLHDLRMRGKKSCRITVTLHNRSFIGEGYKYDIYGDKIIIERNINETPGEVYVFYSADGQQKARGRDELKNICNFFDIHINNPMYFMTQNMAKEFLVENSPKEMYECYSEGVGITKLFNIYNKIRNDSSNIASVVNTYFQRRELLKVEYEDLKNKLKSLQNVSDLNTNLATNLAFQKWREVLDLENKKDSYEKNISEIKRKIKKNEYSIESNTKILSKIDTNIEKISEELSKLNENDDITRTESLLDEVNVLKTNINSTNDDIRKYVGEKDDIDGLHSRALKAVEKIKAEQANNTINIKLNEKNAQKDVLQKELDNLQRNLDKTNTDLNEKRSQLDRLNDELNEIDSNKSRLNQNKKNIISRLNSGTNPIGAYHFSFKNVADEIEKNKRSFKGEVFGPIGTKVKLRNSCKEYWKIIETIIGKHLRSFFIEEESDRILLNNILQKHGCKASIQNVSTKKNIDTSSNEPDNHFLTIDRALIFEDFRVRNVLLILAKIEKVILVESTIEGNKLTENGRPYNCTSVLSKDGFSLGANSGLATSTIPIHKTTNHLLSIESQDETEILKSTLNSLEKDIENNKQLLLDINNKRDALVENLNSMQADFKTTKSNFQLAKTKFQRLVDDIALTEEERRANSDNSSLSLLFKKIEEYEVKNAEFENKIKELTQLRSDYQETLDDLLEQTAEINKANSLRLKNCDNLVMAKEKYSREREQISSRIETSNLNISSDNSKLNDVNLLLEPIISQLKIAQQLAESKSPERPENVPTIEVLLNEEASINGQLKGLSDVVEEEKTVKERYEKVKLERNNFKKEIRRLRQFMGILSESADIGIHNVTNIRAAAATRITLTFSEYMRRNNFPFYLKFNHNEKALEIVLNNTESMDAESTKDARSLSGGEKSYTGLCLLLSIWADNRACLRVLDEYDVFTDAVNRSLMTKLIMSHVRNSDTQYIFITPLELDNLHEDMQSGVVKIIPITKS